MLTATSSDAARPGWGHALNAMRTRPDILWDLLIAYFFATIGIWLPPIVAAYLGRDPAPAFYLGLATGAAYTFALSLLASGSIFIVREYRVNAGGDYRHLKLELVIAAAIVFFLQAVFLGADAARLPPLPAGWHWQHGLQLTAMALSILVAALLYAFERLEDEKPSVAEARQKEQQTTMQNIQEAPAPSGWKAGSSPQIPPQEPPQLPGSAQ